MDMPIAIGFGMAAVTRNGELVYTEAADPDEVWTVRDAENAACKTSDPFNDDWRIIIVGPLREMIYQRQEDGLWVLIESGLGFA
jgi:hypothetical protein